MSGEERRAREDAVARLLQVASPRPAVPTERAERVRAAVHLQWNQKVLWRRRRKAALWGLASFATAATVLLGVRIGYWNSSDVVSARTTGVVESMAGIVRRVDSTSRLRLRVGDTIARGSWLETENDGRLSVRLESGASLRLDMDTRISLESASSVHLERGAVYVDTGADGAGSSALQIRTPLGVARDVGTQFEVRLQDEDILVRVREGMVQLSREGSSHDAPAGNELRMNSSGAIERRVLLPYGREWDWIADLAPPFTLDGASLEEFLGWVTNEHGLRLRFDDPSLADAAATIFLDGPTLQMTPEKALRTVLPTCGLNHRIEDGTLWIQDSE